MPAADAPLRRIGAVVTGRVQGVGYRYFASDAAHQVGTTGWVRNRFDGSVELEAQGAAHTVEQLLTRLRLGPPLSYVKEVRVSELPALAGETGFEIRY